MGLSISPEENFKIIEVSRGGFCIIAESPEAELDGVIRMNSKDSVEFKAIKCWEHNGRAGFKFLENETPPSWKQMIDYSERLFNYQTISDEKVSA